MADVQQTVELAHRILARLRALDVPEQLAARVAVDLADLTEALGAVHHGTGRLLEPGRPRDWYGDELTDLWSHVLHVAYHARQLRLALLRVAEIVDPGDEEDDGLVDLGDRQGEVS